MIKLAPKPVNLTMLLPPMLAFYATCGAGVSLILGLAMLERRGAPHGLPAFERH